jgi:hypothetical protein
MKYSFNLILLSAMTVLLLTGCNNDFWSSKFSADQYRADIEKALNSTDDRKEDIDRILLFLNQAILNWGTEHFEGKTYESIHTEANKWEALFAEAIEVKVVDAIIANDSASNEPVQVTFKTELTNNSDSEFAGLAGDFVLTGKGINSPQIVEGVHLEKIMPNGSFPKEVVFTYVAVLDAIRGNSLLDEASNYELNFKVNSFFLDENESIDRFID